MIKPIFLCMVLIGGMQAEAQSFKEQCVGLLPVSWQEKAHQWFWPTVTCTAVMCVLACAWARYRFFSPDPRQAFTAMVYDLLSAQPITSGERSSGPYAVEVYVFQDASGASVHFSYNKKEFVSTLLKLPLDAVGSTVYDAVKVAMDRFVV